MKQLTVCPKRGTLLLFRPVDYRLAGRPNNASADRKLHRFIFYILLTHVACIIAVIS